MGRTSPVVQAVLADGEGGWVVIVARPLGWDAPYFRHPLTGRAATARASRPGRHTRRIQLLPRPGPCRRPEVAQAP